MGFTPQQVQRMTLDELNAAARGWTRANGGKEDAPPLSDDDYDALVSLGETFSQR